MINIEDFVKRLEKIMEYYSLSASAFADAVGIQRSGVSHLMSGRNKPSLDLILKITENFPEVDLYWLLNGLGGFPKTEENNQTKASAPSLLNSENSDKKALLKQNPDLFSQKQDETIAYNISAESIAPSVSDVFSDEVERIVFFYKNGSFKSYTPKK